MIEKHEIETREEYELVTSRGHEPLIDNRFFTVRISLRVQLQNKLFGLDVSGARDIPKANNKFYHYVWANKIKVCEECMAPLRNFAAIHISHIMTKGAKPQIAFDPRNANLLCAKHHNQWEYGTEKERKKMRIFHKNMQRIAILKAEYAQL